VGDCGVWGLKSVGYMGKVENKRLRMRYEDEV
jgi:hypothetical protein